MDDPDKTGAQNDDGQNDSSGTNKDAQVERLRRERDEWKEKAEKALDATDKDNGNDDDGADDDSLEDDYREIGTDRVISEVSTDIEKLPKTLQEKIKDNPFNPAWFDEKEFKYESLGKKVDSPKVKYAIASKIAAKSIKKFTEDYLEENGGEKDNADGDKGTGINPPRDKNSGNNDANVDLWQLSDEELIARRNAIRAGKK